MEISDIQLKNNQVVITFCNCITGEDIMEINVPKKAAWKIHDYCGKHLSLAAQKKK